MLFRSYFAIYDLKDGRVYAVPVTILKTLKNNFSLRKVAAKNNQKTHIHMAADYALETILRKVCP